MRGAGSDKFLAVRIPAGQHLTSDPSALQGIVLSFREVADRLQTFVDTDRPFLNGLIHSWDALESVEQGGIYELSDEEQEAQETVPEDTEMAGNA